MMKRIFKKLLLSILTLVLVITPIGASAAENPYNSYTYWYEFSGLEKTASYSRPMYETVAVLSSYDLSLETKIGQLIDSFSRNGLVYLLDSVNSQIIILNSDYSVKSVIGEIKDTASGENLGYKDAMGIFVDTDSHIYIADTLNERVLECDENGNLVNKYFLPDSELIPDSFKYRPQKVAKDSRGYMYILSEGSFYGAIMYDPEGVFLGFYGANQVEASLETVIQNIVNKLFKNDAKKSVSERKLPYQFTDLFIDNQNFVYTSTGNTLKDSGIQTGQIKRLSPGGSNILGSDAVDFTDTATELEPQNIVGLEVDENGFIYCVDSTYGHIFVYDSECRMVSAFGGGFGTGAQDGSFKFASSITLNGVDIIITDKTNNNASIFRLTDYGRKFLEAQSLTIDGHYTEALPLWKEIIKLDNNNQAAYSGIAKGYYGLGEYQKAMKYAKLGFDRETYANAFERVRNKFLKENFAWMIAVVLVIIIAVLILKKKFKKPNDDDTDSESRLKCYFGLIAHPADTFRLIKEKKTGSVIIAAVITLVYYVTSVIQITWGGFAYVIFDSENFNALFVLLRTAGLIGLFTISYWCVSTLFGGLGKIKDIFIVTA